MRKRAFIIVCFLLIFSSMSWAATCPSLTQQPSLTGVGDFSPGSIASGNGVIYVAEFFDDTVSAYAKNGSLLKVFSVKKPVVVAIDESSGNIYIGNVAQKSTFYTGGVTVYDKDFNELRELGSGWGEFSFPSSITVVNSRVYVADSRSNVVKIFNESDGSLISYFGGGRGTNAGDLTRPLSVDIDPQTGNVYVGDNRLVYDPYNFMWGMGAGVHVFSADGVYIRSLPIYFGDLVVAGSQKMLAMGGVQVDGSGLVYVADKSQNKLLVFDSSDAFVCDVELAYGAVRPSGLLLTADGKMLLSAAEEVLVYATENMVDMSVSPGSASISAQECSTSQDSQIITVTNNGGGVLEWSASSDSTWITLSETSGSINGMGSATVTLGADTAGLANGEHTGAVTFSSQSGSQAVSVTLTKYAPPALSVAETSFSFEVRGDVVPPAQALNINLSGDIGGQAVWTASSDSLWFGVSPSQGASGLSIAQVGISSTGLAGMEGGTYSGSITVSTGCAGTAPVVVPVSLNYIKGGTIRVTTNEVGASFTISGPATLTGSGLSYVADVVPAGTYTIKFNAIDGFKTPAGSTLEVAEGASVEFSGQYVDLREDNKLVVSSDADGIITLLDDRGGSLGVINASAEARPSVSSTASGDFDGDGIDEIVVAHDGGVITGYSADGALVAGMNFTAFSSKSNVVLAAADLNGDGRDEILAAHGENNGSSTEIRAFGYDGAVVYDTGMVFDAYQKRLGVMMATGDVDGDGVDELITTRGGNSPAGRSVEVRVFKADTTGGPGAWKSLEVSTFAGGTSYNNGLSVAVGDINADAVAEIVVASELSKDAAETHIVSYGASGDHYYSFIVSGTGLRVSSGDVDFDGHSEIVVIDGDANVRIYNGYGSLESEFKALDGAGVAGAKISLGQIVGQ